MKTITGFSAVCCCGGRGGHSTKRYSDFFWLTFFMSFLPLGNLEPSFYPLNPHSLKCVPAPSMQTVVDQTPLPASSNLISRYSRLTMVFLSACSSSREAEDAGEVVRDIEGKAWTLQRSLQQCLQEQQEQPKNTSFHFSSALLISFTGRESDCVALWWLPAKTDCTFFSNNNSIILKGLNYFPH